MTDNPEVHLAGGTPRTDAFDDANAGNIQLAYSRLREHARQLERELAQTKAELEVAQFKHATRSNRGQSMSEHNQHPLVGADLHDALLDCFERRRIPKKVQKAILDWVSQIESAHHILENVKNGAIDVLGIDKHGEPTFAITAQGAEYVEKLLKKK